MEQIAPAKKKKGGPMPGSGRTPVFKNDYMITMSVCVPSKKRERMRAIVKELIQQWLKEETTEEQ